METSPRFTLGKLNVILIAVGFLIVVFGFILMAGSTSGVEFNPDIFSAKRITVAPMVSLFGFMFIVFAILYKPKSK
jgi:hypothetical protein